MKRLKLTKPTTRISVVIAILSTAAAFILVGLWLTRTDTAKQPPKITKEQAIPRAQEYLLKDLNGVDPTLRLMLDFLHRKFVINDAFSGQTNKIDTSSDNVAVEAELKAMARIAYIDSLVDELGSSPTIVAQAANCDRIPLPAGFGELLQTEIDKGGYEMTHAFMGLQFMKELGCSIANYDSLQEQSVAAMLELARDEKTDQDLRYESIALLLYGGKFDTVELSWIDKIYDEQRQDGGWGIKNDKASSDHTTILALWALLEYKNPTIPYEPVVRHPSR